MNSMEISPIVTLLRDPYKTYLKRVTLHVHVGGIRVMCYLVSLSPKLCTCTCSMYVMHLCKNRCMTSRLVVLQLYACVGASLGGMQSLAAAVMFPERVGKYDVMRLLPALLLIK